MRRAAFGCFDAPAVNDQSSGQGPDEIEEVDPMDPEAWYAEPGICGSCIAWRPESPREGETVASGSCRLRKELPRVPATLKLCSLYKPRGQFVYQPGQEPKGKRKRASAVTVMRRGPGDQMVQLKVPARAPKPEPNFDAPYEPTRLRKVKLARPYEVPRHVDVGTESPPLLRQVMIDLCREELGRSGRELLPRFVGGTVEVIDAQGKKRSFPIAKLFTMLDKLKSSMVELEDALARSDALLDQLPEMQKQLSAMQGSFTTFNLLFSDKNDYFGA